jgi:hypothetical protein
LSFNYHVVDGLVPEGYADFLEMLFSNSEIWAWNDSASGVDKNYDVNDTNIVDASQMTHMLFDFNVGVKSDHWPNVSPLFWFLEDRTGLKVNEIMRVKANLTLPQQGFTETNYNPPHVDTSDPQYFSMVYYVNDADGDTRLFNKHLHEGYNNMDMIASNSPKKGSAFIFPSNKFHASSIPVKSDKRMILNFVFAVENPEKLNEL